MNDKWVHKSITSQYPLPIDELFDEYFNRKYDLDEATEKIIDNQL